ncbi:MAG: Zn-ribbon domain-containing OB-fold protein [Actinomycetota bacterium]
MQVGTVIVMAADGVGPAGSAGGWRGGGGDLAPLAQQSPAPLRGTAAASSPPALPSSHPLSDASFRSAVGAVDDTLDISYEWDAGEAMGAFLEGLRDGRIVATHCVACERTLVPPRKFCERCFRPTDRWVEVADTGVVETFSICHVSWDMRVLDPPELPAVIRLDGASQGGFLHKLGEVSPDDLRIGMAVEAVWRPLQERTGSILDIAYFRPRNGGDA